MSCPPQGLSTIPRWEGIGRKTRMHEREMGFVIGIYQIIIVLVDLHRSELALINDVFV
jgi:hypothetical protein